MGNGENLGGSRRDGHATGNRQEFRDDATGGDGLCLHGNYYAVRARSRVPDGKIGERVGGTETTRCCEWAEPLPLGRYAMLDIQVITCGLY